MSKIIKQQEKTLMSEKTRKRVDEVVIGAVIQLLQIALDNVKNAPNKET